MPTRDKRYKLEFVLNAHAVKFILKELETAGVHEYTMLDVTRGKGNKQGDNSDPGIGANKVYLFSICEEAEMRAAAARIEPYFQSNGGLFVISEVFCINP